MAPTDGSRLRRSGSPKTRTTSPKGRHRLGMEGRSSGGAKGRRGTTRPDNQGRKTQASNKAGSGQGARKN